MEKWVPLFPVSASPHADEVDHLFWFLVSVSGFFIVLIVALILGQRETLQSFVAYLTAALGGVGTLARFLAGSKRASESEETHA